MGRGGLQCVLRLFGRGLERSQLPALAVDDVLLVGYQPPFVGNGLLQIADGLLQTLHLAQHVDGRSQHVVQLQTGGLLVHGGELLAGLLGGELLLADGGLQLIIVGIPS